jgi:orotate phosphoribosyltransferase
MSGADRAALARDVNAIARLSGRFVLRSGQVSDVYFDKYRFEADPGLLRRMAAAMLEITPPEAEVLAGAELGGVPLAAAMSLADGRPAAFVRKVAKSYGTMRAVEGGDIAGRKVVIVEDVITTGGAVVEAARHIAEAGGEVIGVVCAIFRAAGEPAIAGLDAPVTAALTAADLAG